MADGRTPMALSPSKSCSCPVARATVLDGIVVHVKRFECFVLLATDGLSYANMQIVVNCFLVFLKKMGWKKLRTSALKPGSGSYRKVEDE